MDHIIGLFQLPLLRKHFSRSAFWIVASTLAWAVSIIITAPAQRSELALLLTFIIGALLYGSITGATLMWVLQKREAES